MPPESIPAGPGAVRRATRRDITALATVLARAFQDDPLTSWILPDDHQRRRHLPAVYAMQLRTWFVDSAETQVCCRDGVIVAGALWNPPGSRHPPLLVQLRQLPTALRLAGRHIGRLATVTSTIARARPDRPHWYLAELATDPDFQRTGLGDQLMRTQLHRCDAEGAPGYLEAPESNINYYERYGFTVTETIAIPSGPIVYGMWRPSG